jgi:lysophospholipase L1-like esterase
MLTLLASGVGAAQEPSDEPPAELPSPGSVANLFGSVADTSRFLTLPSGALDALARRMQEEEGGRPIVVVQYGDSHTEAGVLPRELRDQLAGGGRTSPGYVAPGWHNLGDATVHGTGRWKKKNWLKPGDSGSFGPLGVAWVTRDPRGRMSLHLKDPPPAGTTVTALYSRSAEHLPFRIESDGHLLKEVSSERPVAGSPRQELGTTEVTLPAGASDVELAIAPGRRSGPELRFFGFLVQEPGALVEWDALGVTGTSVEHPLERGDRSIEDYLSFRHPDVVVVWFGSNSLVSPTFNPVDYEKDYEKFLARLAAAAPQASRIAIGPPDLARRPAECSPWYGHHKRRLSRRDRALLPRYVCAPETTIIHRPGKPDLFPVKGISSAEEWGNYIQRCAARTLPAVATAIEAERTAAKATGYAFFDTFAFMDGPGSIHRWACQTPRLAAYDLVHLTADGYTTLAQGVWGSLPASVRSAGGHGASEAMIRP